MHIETLEIAGFYPMLKALHLPFCGEMRSFANSRLIKYDSDEYGEDDSFRPTYEHYEMHTVCDDDKRLLRTLVSNGDEHAKVMRGVVVWAEITAPVYWWCEMETYRTGHERLSSESTMHTDCRGLSGDALVKAKSEIPMGKELKKIDMFSYQCLRHIYKQRKCHRLPEWRSFCEWIETLPYHELITIGLD